ncbi:hypothetical protein [Hymenobacter volaticus]|uniref:ImmA/IrrE family metallo-endopeptidase n=1 Tax=Hymenobacter volaticus TaxID=2932254 RepID=A0ABY4G244_9BACT|nr:hypothetical protein [Hymenobacter volaticus]UOQ64861.1 hypothetical protein MUN86_14960 [Hymenobacter volaticus]
MKELQEAYIHLPSHNATKHDLHMSKHEAERARTYFKALVNKHYIRVKRPKPGMDGGAAQYFSNTIYVPIIRNKGDFYLCLHEIGHMQQPPTIIEKMDPDFIDEAIIIDEYKADLYALEHAQLFGVDTTIFQKHAMCCLFPYVKKVHQKKVKWANMDERVRDIVMNWLGITEADWSAHELIIIN